MIKKFWESAPEKKKNNTLNLAALHYRILFLYWVLRSKFQCTVCQYTMAMTRDPVHNTSDEPPLKFGLFWNKFMFDLCVFWDPWLNNCRVHSTGSPNRTFNSPKSGPKMHKGLTLKEKILNLFLFSPHGQIPRKLRSHHILHCSWWLHHTRKMIICIQCVLQTGPVTTAKAGFVTSSGTRYRAENANHSSFATHTQPKHIIQAECVKFEWFLP